MSPRRPPPSGPAPDPVRLGISSCLLGNKVRYDGQHKRDAFLVETVGPLVTFVAVCPESEVGMGIPRPTVRLERAPEGLRMVCEKNGVDWTARMQAWARTRVAALAGQDLDGFVLKKSSPSCGMERVKVFSPGTPMPTRDGMGLFAAALRELLPELPLEEEGRLCDPGLREAFFERVFAYRRLKRAFADGWQARDVVLLHSREKMLLMAHSPAGYRALGPLVARAGETERDELRRAYVTGFQQALTARATVGRHANVLQHLAGYFKDRLEADDRDELHQAIDDFRARRVPLLVPLTLLRHHARRCGVAYLLGQSYLQPSPDELLLRNHA